MNKTRLALVLAALAGSVAGGVAIIQGLVVPGAPLQVECGPTDCVLVAQPDPAQCPALLEGGGDRPGVDPSNPNHRVGVVLQALGQHGAHNGWHTVNRFTDGVDGGPAQPAPGCEVVVFLSLDQAAAWRSVLTGTQRDAAPDPVELEAAVGLLRGVAPRKIPVMLSGGSAPEDRTESFDLKAQP